MLCFQALTHSRWSSVSNSEPTYSDGPAQDADRLAILNHDLRSAVSDIVGGLRLIDHQQLDQPTLVQLERIRTSAEQLARILEDELSSPPGRVAPNSANRSNLNLERFLTALDLRWSGHAQQRHLNFVQDIAPDLPQVISTDRIALDRVLTNALSNAMKFARRGDVTFRASVVNRNTLRFSVLDDGPGFSDEALERLFLPDGRPQHATEPGTGLGLFISYELAHRLGGKLSVHNRSEGGSCVQLDLPANAWQLPNIARDSGIPDLSHLKVLVAEDNPTLQLVVSQMLGSMGAEIEIASDGVEAVNWLQRESFDVMLLDIEMPRMSGLDVLKTVRRMPAPLNDMPIIAMTAFVLNANREAIHAAGADGIISKPITRTDAFGEAIIAFYDRARNQPAPKPELPLGGDMLDRRQFDELMAIAGRGTQGELLDRLTQDLTVTGDRLRAAAGETMQAEIRAMTHNLIALAGAIGATCLQDTAQKLNLAAHDNDMEQVEALRGKALELLERLKPMLLDAARDEPLAQRAARLPLSELPLPCKFAGPAPAAAADPDAEAEAPAPAVQTFGTPAEGIRTHAGPPAGGDRLLSPVPGPVTPAGPQAGHVPPGDLKPPRRSNAGGRTT